MEKCADAAPVSTDSVLLANFVNLSGARRIADFGCGSGLIAIILAKRSPHAVFDCVELSELASDCARRNIERNGLSDRLCVLNQDLRTLREKDVGKYQLIVSNPPYFAVGSGTSPAESSRLSAREEHNCTLSELAYTVSRLLGDGGRFAMVYPTERMSEALCTLSSAGLEPKRLRLVQARQSLAPSIALMEFRRNGKPGLSVEPVLILKNDDGSDTDEVRRIYRLN
jgi:tRNA1(Val) A37 N6-methylase TrmN6